MQTERPSKILLNAEFGTHGDGPCTEVLSPGMALSLSGDGSCAQAAPSKAEMAKQGWAIAREDRLQGRTTVDAYASGDIVQHYTPVPGNKLMVLVKSGQTILQDDNGVIEGGGSGLFVKAAGTEAKYHVKFLESSDGALAANTLLRARLA